LIAPAPPRGDRPDAPLSRTAGRPRDGHSAFKLAFKTKAGAAKYIRRPREFARRAKICGRIYGVKQPVFRVFSFTRPASSIPQEFLKSHLYPVPVHK
jgi:hypothetical protein